jgi:hypothetical protein
VPLKNEVLFMMRRIALFAIAAIVAVAAVWLITSRAATQEGSAPNREGASARATPRMPDGKPDLSGVWMGGGGGDGGVKPDAAGNLTVLTRGRPCAPGQSECAPGINFERDSGVRQRMNPNVPLYKPEYWERVQYLDQHGNIEDPEWKCRPPGLPRMGPPNKIVQTTNEVIFLYQNHNTFRVIPTDGRTHDPVRAADVTWHGDSVGSWEGDTLVIDVVGFTDESWLAWPGWFHSNNMRVIERLSRDGDKLTWQATVEDPDVLLKPWVMDPRTLTLNPNAKALLIEDLPCEERDLEHMTSRERG